MDLKSELQKLGKTNKLLDGIKLISEAIGKSSDEILEALSISKKQFEAMPGIQEFQKMLLNLKYVHEKCDKLRNDILNYKENLSEEQIDSTDEVIRFIPEYEPIQKYFEENIKLVRDDRSKFMKIHRIIGDGDNMSINILGLYLFDPSQICSIRHLLLMIHTFESRYKEICEDQRFKLLVK